VKTATHPSGLIINFNEEKHRYVDETGKRYYGTTSVIHSQFPRFDAERIAGFVARKRGCTREEVLQEWELKRKTAADFGTRIHTYADASLTGEVIAGDTSTRENLYIEQVQKLAPKLLKHYDLLGTEVIVFSPQYNISGTLDVLMRNKRTKSLAIFDWKTNEEIRSLNKHKPSQRGFGVLSHVPDSNFFHYQLQLSLYSKIIEIENYFNINNFELAIFHIQAEKIIPYKMKYMESEATDLLKISKNLSLESFENLEE